MLVATLALLAPLQVTVPSQGPALPPKTGTPRGPAPAPLAYELSTGAFAQPGFEGGDTELELADVNDDGHLDIVSIGDHGSPFVNTQQHGVMVWFGDGTGAFTLVQNGNFGYGGVAIGDANNDGLADVAYGLHHDYSQTDFGDQLLEVALGDGTGLAWTPWDDGLATNGETWGMFATDLGDVDSDGWLDVLSNSFGCCAGVHVYRNQTDGSWQQSFGFLGGNADPFALFGDVDGDGHLDVAAANSMGNLWRGDGAGGFALEDGDLSGTASTRRGFDLGDVDGDGRDELAFVLAGDVRVAGWSAPGTWIDQSDGLPTGFGFSMVQVEDMDLDGHPDLVAFGGGRVAVFRGDGGSGWTFAKSLQVGSGGTAVALRAADVDHNGRPDIALIQDESCGLFCSRNTPYFFLEVSDPPALAVALRHPGPGTAWVEGGARVVEWQAAVPGQGPGLVTIELSSSGPAGPWQVLADGVPNDGRHQLIVPAGSASDDAHLRLSVTAGKTHTVQSGPFRIRP